MELAGGVQVNLTQENVVSLEGFNLSIEDLIKENEAAATLQLAFKDSVTPVITRKEDPLVYAAAGAEFTIDGLDCWTEEITKKIDELAKAFKVERKDLWVSFEQDKKANKTTVKVEGLFAS